jgi:ribose transport system substrate-binding protein
VTSYKRIIAATMGLLAGAASIAACGSTASASPSKGSGSGSLAACVSKANAIVSQAENPAQKLMVPTLNISSLKGKTVWIDVDNSVSLLLEQTQGFTAGLKAAGIKSSVYDNNGTAPSEAQGVEEAIGAHASAIAIDAIDPDLISDALVKAGQAHIPVISLYNPPLTPTLKGVIKGTVYLNGQVTGKQMAAYILANTGCKANIGYMYSSVYYLHQVIRTELQSFLRSMCPATCKLYSEQYDPTTASTTVGPQAVSFVQSHTGMNGLILATDLLATNAVPALQAANKHLIITTEGGTPNDIALVKQGTLLKANIDNASNTFVGWTAADLAMRVMLGKPSAPNDTFYFRMLAAGHIPANGKYFGFTNYPSIFKKAWGV